MATQDQIMEAIFSFVYYAKNQDEKKSYLEQHPELLTDEALQVLELLIEKRKDENDNKSVETLTQHRDLLLRCRQEGIDAIIPRPLSHHEQAIKDYQSDLEDTSRHDFPEKWASIQHNLGNAYRDRIKGTQAENIEQAIYHYQKALEIYTDQDFPEEWANTQLDLALAYEKRLVGGETENFVQAISHYKQALHVFSPLAFPTKSRTVAYKLGRTLHQFGVQIEEKASSEKKRRYSEAKQASKPAFESAREAFETAHQAVDALWRESQDAAKERLAEENADMYARLVDTCLFIRDEVAAFEYAVAGKERRWVDTLVHRGFDISDHQEAPRLTASQAMILAHDLQATLIEYVEHAGGWSAFVVTKDAIEHVLLKKVDENFLDEIIGYIYLCENDIEFILRNETVTRKRLTQVYAALIAPLQKHLPPAAQGKRLIIAPFGALHQLPLNAAQNPDTKAYLSQEYTLTATPSLAALRVSLDVARQANWLFRPPESPIHIAHAGHPDMTSIKLLQKADQSASEIAAIFPNLKQLSAENATLQAAVSDVANRDLVHFYCHGTFEEDNPNQSGLLLHDGFLTVQRIITDLDLKQTHLTALAACQSGREDVKQAEELVGLIQALLIAGSKSVVANLWKVDEEATQAFFRHFYQALQNGDSPAEALSHAQSEIRQTEDKNWLHPYYWAAFQISGLAYKMPPSKPFVSKHENGDFELNLDATTRIANNHLPVTWPAIFATFYYYYGDDDNDMSADEKASPLLEHLKTELKLSEDPDSDIWKGEDKQKKIRFRLRWVKPVTPHAKDVKIVQLVLSDIREDRAATLVWPKMFELLTPLLREYYLNNLFGYTLTYQAVIPDPRPPTPTLSDILLPAQLRGILSGNSTPPTPTFSSLLAHVELEELLKVTKRLDRARNLEALAETFVLEEKGKVWLLNIPNLDNPKRDRHLEKGTVYLALSLKSANNDMLDQVIYRQSASLFMPDLMAHRGYDQIREYRMADEKEPIRPQLQALADQSVQVLEKLGSRTEMGDLADKYGKSLITNMELDRLRILLAGQVYNYDLWKKKANASEVTDYHEEQLSVNLKELELDIGRGRSTLQATDTVVTIVQTRVQSKIEVILIIVSVILVFTQIVDDNIAGALLGWPEPKEGYNSLLMLGPRIGISVVAAIGVFVLWWLLKLVLLKLVPWRWQQTSLRGIFLLALVGVGIVVWLIVDEQTANALLNIVYEGIANVLRYLVSWFQTIDYNRLLTLGTQAVITVVGAGLLTFVFWLLSRLFKQWWPQK